MRNHFHFSAPAPLKRKEFSRLLPREKDREQKTMEKKKSSVLEAIRRFLPWVAIACVILALVPRMGELRQCLERLSVVWLIPAFGLCLGYWFFNAGVWSFDS